MAPPAADEYVRHEIVHESVSSRIHVHVHTRGMVAKGATMVTAQHLEQAPLLSLSL